jgi:hypothetical protein
MPVLVAYRRFSLPVPSDPFEADEDPRVRKVRTDDEDYVSSYA